MATGKQPRMVTACTMLKRMLFRYQGNVSAALVLGGVDCDGPSLFMVYPHGSTDKLPYGTMGSGSLAAMAVFESQYKSGMNVEEAKALVHAASTHTDNAKPTYGARGRRGGAAAAERVARSHS